jgi:Fe-S cluster biogenesis protein NfuA
VGCPMSVMTLRAGIERILIRRVPEIRRIEQVK